MRTVPGASPSVLTDGTAPSGAHGERAAASGEATDLDALGDGLLERLDVGDDAHDAPARPEPAERREDGLQRLGVQAAEALVDEQRPSSMPPASAVTTSASPRARHSDT